MSEPNSPGRFERGIEALHELADRLQRFPHVTLGTMAATIEQMIAYGAQLYNEGQLHQCYRLYAQTARQLMRGADAMELEALAPQTREAVEDLRRAEQRAREHDDHAHAAWMLRHAFDKIMITHQLHMETVQWMMRLAEASFAREDYAGSVDALRTAIACCPALWSWDDLVTAEPERPGASGEPDEPGTSGALGEALDALSPLGAELVGVWEPREDDAAQGASLGADQELEPDLEIETTSVQAAHLAYMYYGNGLLLCGRFDEAAQALRQCLRLSPRMASLPLDLRQLGPHYAAFMRQHEFLQDHPEASAPDAASFLAAFLAHFSGQPRLARERLTLHLRRHPDDEAAHMLLAISSPKGRGAD